jgi:hypothetical protein
MWEKRAKARESEFPGHGPTPSIQRRTFLGAALLLWAWPRELLAAAAQSSLSEPEGPLSEPVLQALRDSEFVYVSPLSRKGEESTCHAEVWYGWLDGSVVLITSKQSWKARSVERGLDKARIWVGSYGRWKRFLGRNEEFRKGPSFDALARTSRDPALLERLLSIYDQKYPDEIDRWRERFRSGLASGERVLIRYEPSTS